MVSRLVQEKDVSLEEHGTSKSELHLPTTGQATNGVLLALIREADGSKGLDDLLLASLNALIRDDELENGGVGFAAIDIVLDVECANLIGRREAFNLTGGKY